MNISLIVIRAIDLYQFVIIAYLLMSWFQGASWAIEIRRMLAPLVEPFIAPFRRIVPQTGTIDFSPLVALLVLQWLVRPAILILLRSLGL